MEVDEVMVLHMQDAIKVNTKASHCVLCHLVVPGLGFNCFE